MFDKRSAFDGEEALVKAISEDHFNDAKSKRIAPSKLQETFVAFANSDGGDLYIGVEDEKVSGERLIGFENEEEANEIIHHLLENTTPSVESMDLEFIDFGTKGLVLHIVVPKSPSVHYCANGECYIRVNARKTKIKGDRIAQLAYSKGFYKYEQIPIKNAEVDDYIGSDNVLNYKERVGTKLDTFVFLRKQKLLAKVDSEVVPNVGCALLFDEDPAAEIGSNCSLRVYRLLTSDTEYNRDKLKEKPTTINGPIESQIHNGIKEVNRLLADATVVINGKSKSISYPAIAIHEILVNAVIHRDYSISDDIHVRIYDNRVEIVSPGKLPGYINIKNIYEERFARNPNLVRMLHNLPDPVNHNIGEGLDTARNEMKKLNLVDPEIIEMENSVKVVLKHKRVQSLREVILRYLRDNPGAHISNGDVRAISGEDDVNKVKKAIRKLRTEGLIEKVDPSETNYFNYKYKLVD